MEKNVPVGGLLLGILAKAVDDAMDMYKAEHGSRTLEFLKVALIASACAFMVGANNPYVTAVVLSFSVIGAVFVPDEYFHDPFYTAMVVVIATLAAYLLYTSQSKFDPRLFAASALVALALIGFAFVLDFYSSLSANVSDAPLGTDYVNAEVSESKFMVRLGAATIAAFAYGHFRRMSGDAAYIQGLQTGAIATVGYCLASAVNQAYNLYFNEAYNREAEAKNVATKQASLRAFSHANLLRSSLGMQLPPAQSK